MMILLDPGHGGEKPGAVYGGIEEEDINLAVALRCGRTLRPLGHDVIYTRDRDEDVTLSQRLDMIERFAPEVFVSIHCNASRNDMARGVETYYRDDLDWPLANSIQTVLVRYTGRKDRGVLQDQQALGKRLTVLNNLVVPAALVELGYLSNPEERGYLIGSINTLGDVLAHGIDDYCHKKSGTVKTTWPEV